MTDNLRGIVVAPFRYVAAPFSVLLGYLWWGDLPDAAALLGIGMVVAAGLHTLHRERAGLRAVPASQSASP
jgi:drug/metabolite transporter (DMT)-like permease